MNIRLPLLKLKALPLNTMGFMDTSWLPGFIDADGSFYITLPSTCGFSLKQSKSDHNGHSKKNFKLSLANYLLVNAYFGSSTKCVGKKAYEIKASSKRSKKVK